MAPNHFSQSIQSCLHTFYDSLSLSMGSPSPDHFSGGYTPHCPVTRADSLQVGGARPCRLDWPYYPS